MNCYRRINDFTGDLVQLCGRFVHDNSLGVLGVLALKHLMHTVDAKEIENFAKDSSHWWDEDGPFRPLHRLNPVRLQYIKERICEGRDIDAQSLKPYRGLSVLDIGCGGGLVCEPMARLGADVTGIDADKNATVAAAHAADGGLDITYKAASSEQLVKEKNGSMSCLRWRLSSMSRMWMNLCVTVWICARRMALSCFPH